MKTTQKVILLFEDADVFATAISDGLQPKPSSSFQTLKVSFELPLEQYGINEKASGSIFHFEDSDGLYQVSILLLQQYEPPVLTYAVNEVLASIGQENSSNVPTLILPFFLAASKLKLENKSSITVVGVSLYGKQIGSETDITKALLNRIEKLRSPLQTHHEPLACSLQLIRVMKVPAIILVGQSVQNLSLKTSEGEFKDLHFLGHLFQLLCEMGETLASALSLCFIREDKMEPNQDV